MSKKNNYPEQDVESFSLKNFLLLCLGSWKWFLASLVVFVGYALFYIYKSQPVYERYEEILVKDQENGGGVGEVSSSFTQLGLFANQTKVFNELIAFTSPAVMAEVVDKLDLTLNTTQVDGMRRTTLYGTNLPLKFEFPTLSEFDNVSFNMKVQPDGTFVLYKMKKYEPSGVVKFSEEISGKVNGRDLVTPIGTVRISRNPVYVEPAVKKDEEKEIEVFKQAKLLAIEKYGALLKGDLTDQDADVINLSIRDTSVERADAILNTVVEVYNERWIEDKNKVAVATSKFISERLAVIEKELGAVDKSIAEQKSDMGLPNIEEAAKNIYAHDMLISEQRIKLTTLMSMTQFLKEYVENPANTFNVIPMNTGIENPVLEEQIGLYNQQLLQRNALAENSSPDNPLVRDKDIAIAGIRASILRSIESNIANMKSALGNISAEQNNNRSQLSTAPKQAMQLLSDERQQEVMHELYLFLLQKREENELTQSFTADNIRIITPPYGKLKPVAPRKGLWIIIFGILGLGIPMVALFIAETSNTKIRSKKDMENLPIPFAGEIPYVGKEKKWIKMLQSKSKKKKEIDKPKVIVSEGKRDIPNEAFRVVRSNIDFMLGKGGNAVLALTSFNPGSGKSFVAYNLGVSFALKAKRVLIIDGDLRHGSISMYVNSPRKGLSSYLTGNQDDWHQLVVKVPDMENLNILPIGHRPPNPAELLENGRLRTLIEEAKQEYDIVLIDCPPVNIVVDTQIINQYVDRTLFVIRAGLLEKKALADLNELVEEKKLKNISVLLNGTKSEFSSYYSYGNYEAIDKT